MGSQVEYGLFSQISEVRKKPLILDVIEEMCKLVAYTFSYCRLSFEIISTPQHFTSHAAHREFYFLSLNDMPSKENT